jgi:hypothetical protein
MSLEYLLLSLMKHYSVGAKGSTETEHLYWPLNCRMSSDSSSHSTCDIGTTMLQHSRAFASGTLLVLIILLNGNFHSPLQGFLISTSISTSISNAAFHLRSHSEYRPILCKAYKFESTGFCGQLLEELHVSRIRKPLIKAVVATATWNGPC